MMDIESSSSSTIGNNNGGTQIALHPLSIVHMSDQYTRITSGGSPLDKTAPVVGLLFGLDEERRLSIGQGHHRQQQKQNGTSQAAAATATTTKVLQIKDADDIPVEISDTSKLQIDLHKAVFPQHRVVGWYRVSSSSSSTGGSNTSGEEPTAEDLQITQQLKASYAPDDSFCFCLLNVLQQQQRQQKDDEDTKMKSSDDDDDDDDIDMDGGNTLANDLPINLFELKDVSNNSNSTGSSSTTMTTVLLNIPAWRLETSDAERIAVERVMNEKPSEVEDGSPSHNPYMVQTRALQHSLQSMKDRVHVIIQCLEAMQSGSLPQDPSLLRQIQASLCSLGPLSTLAHGGSSYQSMRTNFGGDDGIVGGGTVDDDVELLSHLALVARTVSAVQSYTEKFRVMHEHRDAATQSGGGSASVKDTMRRLGGF